MTPTAGETTRRLRRLPRWWRCCWTQVGTGAGQPTPLTANDPAAPHLLTFEAANIIRRHELAALITADQAAQAHADRLDLAVGQWPEYLLAPSWQLRNSLTTYDANDVALAELLEVPLITRDRRIGRAPELRCSVITPAGDR